MAWVFHSQSTNIIATVRDLYGCSTTDSVSVATHPCCNLELPNAFSPNGDNENDMFKPFPTGHYKILSFVIYNRWGELVYSSTSPNPAWDGMFDGKASNMGTYFYRLQYHCEGSEKILSKKGDITLIR